MYNFLDDGMYVYKIYENIDWYMDDVAFSSDGLSSGWLDVDGECV